MRVLILGGGGMLGHKLCQLFRERFDAWGSVRSTNGALGGYDLLDSGRMLQGVDAMRLPSIAQAIDSVRPDAVINCIGIIKQLRDAKNPAVCMAVNSHFPHQLAELCRAGGARLIHISTDCVFSGRKGMYTEADVADAEDLYGRSKCLGEVKAGGCLTLRTSIIGRELSTSSGLVEWLLSNRGGEVRGFRRAIFTGFTTRALAGVLADVLENHPDLEGLYHVSSDPIDKYELLRLLNEIYELGIQIEPDADFVCDRSLDSSRFRRAVAFRPPSWPEMVEEMRADPSPYDEWRAPTNSCTGNGRSRASCSQIKCF